MIFILEDYFVCLVSICLDRISCLKKEEKKPTLNINATTVPLWQQPENPSARTLTWRPSATASFSGLQDTQTADNRYLFKTPSFAFALDIDWPATKACSNICLVNKTQETSVYLSNSYPRKIKTVYSYYFLFSVKDPLPGSILKFNKVPY